MRSSIWLCALPVLHMYLLLGCMEVVVRATLPVRPPDSTVYPATLTVAASRTVLKANSSSQSHWDHLSVSAQRREERRKVEKRGRAVQLSLCLPLFSSFHLKLWDAHLSLIAHRHSTREKVLWICINTAYGSSSAGTRCVQKVECCRCIILHSNYHSEDAAGSGEVFTTSVHGAGQEPGYRRTAGPEDVRWAQEWASWVSLIRRLFLSGWSSALADTSVIKSDISDTLGCAREVTSSKAFIIRCMTDLNIYKIGFNY